MRRVLLTILGIILALLILVPAGGYLFLRRSLPQVNATITVPGLQGPVEIVRDADGVPYIYASNDLDAIFGQGYVHAQDRLWQMEFQRRVGAGRLSEVLGESTVDTDKFLRTLGTYRAAQQAWEALSPEAQQVVNAYVGGVNAYLAGNPTLPVEFTILGFTP
ncbi:MAG: penicillin acylase family protein, partial [Anaerolineae bacterium]